MVIQSGQRASYVVFAIDRTYITEAATSFQFPSQSCQIGGMINGMIGLGQSSQKVGGQLKWRTSIAVKLSETCHGSEEDTKSINNDIPTFRFKFLFFEYQGLGLGDILLQITCNWTRIASTNRNVPRDDGI